MRLKRIKKERLQRKFVFPNPRPVSYYVRQLKRGGFSTIHITQKKITVRYKDWLNFLLVKRLQAGILPEIGGKEPTLQEDKERGEIITKAARLLFKQLEKQNALANHTSFTTEWIYFQAKK